MKIIKKVYDQIISDLANLNYESGGIIGIKDNVICAYAKDNNQMKNIDSYEPNVDFLNKTLEEWFKDDIALAGIVHNHLNGCNQLSNIDINYFEEIIKANKIDVLYCPLITFDKKPQFDLFKIDSEVQKINIEII